mgnify:CR=1 FL=1
MENNETKSIIDSHSVKFSQHVEIDMGSTFCIVSCSKHRLPNLISAVDNLVEKGWSITSGLTSDDGLVFQGMSKFSKDEELLKQKKGV